MNSIIPTNEMQKIRVFYNKKGRAKYISHLDITRCMQRALKRANVPVWYTEGYNPHIYLTFALPLSLGYESESEAMDLRLAQNMPFDEVKDRLNDALPPDIRVVNVDLQKLKSDAIKTAIYDVTLTSNELSGQLLKDCLENFFNQEIIEVVKHTKKGNKTIDIKPDIKLNSIEVRERSIKIEIATSAGIEKNINPTLMTDEMVGKYNLKNIQTSVLRKKILDINGEPFA